MIFVKLFNFLVALAFFTLEMDYPSLGAFIFKSVFQKNIYTGICNMQKLCCKFLVL